MTKVYYFFPVFKDDKIKDCLMVFLKSECFVKHKNSSKFIFACEKTDKNNLDFLLSESLKHEEYKLVIFDKPFTYNDAFYNCLKYFDGDVLLLGDAKVAKIDKVFESCLKKYEKNINVVHVVKKNVGIKGFFRNIGQRIYNFFVKIFSNKTDRCNVISLGLIDKHVAGILKEVSFKRCFLKNTKDFLGFETRTIYIPDNTNVYKSSFRQKTTSLILTCLGFGLALIFTILMIVINALVKSNLAIFNIVSAVAVVLSLITSIICFPKHIFDVRNKPSSNVEYNLEEKN